MCFTYSHLIKQKERIFSTLIFFIETLWVLTITLPSLRAKHKDFLKEQQKERGKQLDSNEILSAILKKYFIQEDQQNIKKLSPTLHSPSSTTTTTSSSSSSFHSSSSSSSSSSSFSSSYETEDNQRLFVPGINFFVPLEKGNFVLKDHSSNSNKNNLLNEKLNNLQNKINEEKKIAKNEIKLKPKEKKEAENKNTDLIKNKLVDNKNKANTNKKEDSNNFVENFNLITPKVLNSYQTQNLQKTINKDEKIEKLKKELQFEEFENKENENTQIKNSTFSDLKINNEETNHNRYYKKNSNNNNNFQLFQQAQNYKNDLSLFPITPLSPSPPVSPFYANFNEFQKNYTSDSCFNSSQTIFVASSYGCLDSFINKNT